MPALKLAKTIQIHSDGLSIDGTPLGYYLADEPITIVRESGPMFSVNVTLLAESVGIDPPLHQESVTETTTLVTAPKGGE